MSEFYTSVHYFFQNPTQHIAQLLGTIKPAIAKLVHIAIAKLVHIAIAKLVHIAIAKLVHIAIAKLVHISWKPHLHS